MFQLLFQVTFDSMSRFHVEINKSTMPFDVMPLTLYYM